STAIANFSCWLRPRPADSAPTSRPSAPVQRLHQASAHRGQRHPSPYFSRPTGQRSFLPVRRYSSHDDSHSAAATLGVSPDKPSSGSDKRPLLPRGESCSHIPGNSLACGTVAGPSLPSPPSTRAESLRPHVRSVPCRQFARRVVRFHPYCAASNGSL